MKCSAFIATSADGFIARAKGEINWLHSSGRTDVDLGEQADMGFHDYITSVDCMVMGRNTLETIAAMNLTTEQWPYKDLKVVAISSSLQQAPSGLPEAVEIHNGSLVELVSLLKAQGFNSLYVDGGTTIQNFIREGLLNEITITQIPRLIGSGISLFGEIEADVHLRQAKAQAYANDFVQLSYQLEY
ncbi:dihydrofolate reductase family protein [Paraferrimonas sedimenticola]|uniref:Diacylglycerol kinase n=1 Tax=Paraferrimonas sedimenticola TaxID=375674 RepID=A0AA37RWB9_9GAMM|nr:dihydrofolate reductase family protein [Paraferrimonas sedimenticola]GLP96406.1 diacylglycerol kinase [Paraferrimonas sedimenticola]